MKKCVFSKLVPLLLGDYFEGFDPKELEVSFDAEEVMQSNLKLKNDIFLAQNIPLVIKNSIVKNIKMHIPWKTGFSDSSLSIDGISFLGKYEKCNENSNKCINNSGLFGNILSGENISKKSFFDSILFSIIKNLEINLTNLFIVIEISNENETNMIGIKINEIKISKINDENSEIIKRNLSISGISVFIDNNVQPETYSEDFIQQVSSKNHGFIIENESFNGSFEHSLSSKKNTLNVHIQKSALKIDHNQSKALKFLWRIVSDKPLAKSEVYKKDDKKSFDNVLENSLNWKINVNHALGFLRNRKRVRTELFGLDKDAYEEKVKNYEEEFGRGLTHLLVEYSNEWSLKEMNNKFISETGMEENKEELIGMIKKNENELGDELSILFEIENIKVDFFDRERKESTLEIPLFKGTIEKGKERTKFNALWSKPSYLVTTQNNTNALSSSEFIVFDIEKKNDKIEGTVDSNLNFISFDDRVIIEPFSICLAYVNENGTTKLSGKLANLFVDTNKNDFMIIEDLLMTAGKQSNINIIEVLFDKVIYDIKEEKETKIQCELCQSKFTKDRKGFSVSSASFVMKQNIFGKSNFIEGNNVTMNFNEQITINFEGESKMNLNNKVTQWLRVKTESHKSKIKFTTNVFTIDMINREEKIGTLVLQPSTLDVSIDKSIEITLNANKPKLIIEELGENKVALESNFTFFFHKLDDTMDSFCRNISVVYKQEIIKKFFDFFSAIKEEKVHLPEEPTVLPQIQFNTTFDTANVKIIGNEGSEITAQTEKLSFSTKMDAKTYFIAFDSAKISDKSEKEFASITKLGVYIHFRCTKDVPKVNQGFNGSIEEKYAIKGAYFINGIEIDTTFDNIDYYFDENCNASVVNVIQSFYNTKYEPPKMFSITKGVSIDAKEAKLTIPELCTINMKNFSYGNAEGILIAVGSIALSSAVKQEGIPDPIISCDNQGRTGLSFQFTPKATSLVIDGIVAYFDIDLIQKIKKIVDNTIFMKTTWKEAKEIKNFDTMRESMKKGIKISLISAFIKVPVASDCKETLLLMGSLSFGREEGKANIDLNNMTMAFLKEPMGRTQTTICNNFSLLFNYSTEIVFDIKGADFTLTSSDIAALHILINNAKNLVSKFLIPVEETRECENEEEEEEKDDFAHLGKDLHVYFDMLKLQICFSEAAQIDGKPTPLMRFWLDTFAIHYNFITKEKHTALFRLDKCEVFNIPMQQWDTLLEPIKARMLINPQNNNIDLTINDPLNTSISLITTKQLISFFVDIKEKIVDHDFIKSKQVPLEIVNNTGEDMLFSTEKGGKFTLLPTESKFENISNAEQVRASHGERVWEISLNDLFYPNYLRRSVVCYRINTVNTRKIVFSSTFLITNCTPYTLVLGRKLPKHQRDLLTKLSPNVLTPFPNAVETSYVLTVCDLTNLEKGSNLPHLTLDTFQEGSIPIKVPVGDMRKSMIFECVKNKKKHLTNIFIHCNTVIENEIPEKICIAMSGVIEPTVFDVNQKINYCISSSQMKPLYIWLEREGNKATCVKPAKISEKDSTSSVVINSAILGQTIEFAVSVSHDANGVQRITIFSPLIIKNLSGFSFFVTDVKRKKSAAMEKNGDVQRMYWSDPDFFNDPDKRSIKILPFAINPNVTFDIPIECVGLDDSMFYLLPMNEDKSLSLPLRYRISSSNHSRVITFYAALKINNLLPYDIIIIPKSIEGKPLASNTFQAGKMRSLAICDNQWTFLLKTKECSLSAELILQSPTQTTFLLHKKAGYDLIELNVELKNETMVVTFKLAVVPQAIMISNETDRVIIAAQEGFSPVQIFEPETTQVFAFNQPYQQTNINLVVAENTITLSPVDVNISNKFGDLFAEVVISKKGSKIIRITKEPLKHRKVIPMLFTVSIDTISYSIIDERIKEIALLTISGITLISNHKKEGTEFSLAIHEIELDDLHPSAIFEAAAFCRSEDRVSDFLVAGLVMKPNTPFFTAFKTIAVKTGIIELYLDLSFVSDFIQVINSIIPNAKIKSEELEYTETTKKQLEYTMSCDQLIINPCVLDVSIERETSRKKEYPPISSLLTFIPSASQSRITLDGIELTGFESTQAYIMQNLINPLISEAKQKAAKLFLNVDILLNIGGITDNIIRGQKDPNMTALDVTADTALRIGENIFVAASRIVHGVTADSPITGTSHNRVGLNMTAKETAINGMKSLGVSLLDAPAGIFMDPIRGAQKEGFFGFVKGIGTGITGIITRPVSGIMDATSGLITASRKAVENNTDVHKRLRQSRATVFGVVTPYNHSVAELQLTIRLRDPGSGTLTETVEVVFGQQKAVALTQDAIYFFNEKKEIDKMVPMNSIINCNLYGKDIMINTVGDIKYTLQPDSQKVAQLVHDFIRSASNPAIVEWL